MFVSRVIRATPSRAWTAIATYEQWSLWGVSITDVEVESGTESGGPVDDAVVRRGARGRVRTKLGVTVPFEITEVVPGESWRWSVAGVDATDHEVARHEDGCKVTFSAPWWAAPYRLVLGVALRDLARALES